MEGSRGGFPLANLESPVRGCARTSRAYQQPRRAVRPCAWLLPRHPTKPRGVCLAWPEQLPPGNVAGQAGAAPRPGLSTKMGLPNPRQRCPAAERYGKSPSVLKKAPLQHLKSSFLANKMFTFKIIIIKKRIPALGHSVKWLQAHSSVCPLPSPSPNPATSPALYSRRVTDSPRSMLISVLNKHISPGLLGRARCQHLAGRQKGQTSPDRHRFVFSSVSAVPRELGEGWDVALGKGSGQGLFCIFLL